jgi:hypothetical protein
MTAEHPAGQPAADHRPPLQGIREAFDQLLDGAARYYTWAASQLESDSLDPAARQRLEDAQMRATELIEVLESVTFDRVRWLEQAAVTS